MRFYKMYFDIKHEEKIFGGYLSLRQVIYLIIIVLNLGVFLLKIPLLLKISIYSIIAIFFLACSFIKIKEINFDRYVLNIVKYLLRKKIFRFER